ncbi:hypothetical protein BKA04_002325 [Cryobacterium mesophilum]|uniref:HD domain-containing protein n=1 Tax=Terrimesophilobacter mesophilus TaxID=433647 RepID=A0A4R8VA14_9MICO|nr:hypothetical protein [Terrimesophilobacter mesophilus]MBB5634102.1 hypothetical protein [Terrimesophilobacter mesophilus]TFB78687.1 hypothetical protein E3N84_00475 [Terrimesophilobacter mesophilus]
MEQNPSQPGTVTADVGTLPPVDVAQADWPSHSLLRRARLNIMGDGLEWPHATYEQLPFLREITLVVDDGVLCARLSAQFNFDRFVDAATEDNGPAQPLGHVPDRQRFYTRVTDNGFHVVGVFSAATIGGRRRYFQWLTGAWVEIGLNGFLYVRDDLDTHFSEISGAQLDETQPGATTTTMTPDEEWTMETVQSQFVGEPFVESAPQPLPPPAATAEPLATQAPAPVTAPTPPIAEAPVAEPDAEPAPVPAQQFEAPQPEAAQPDFALAAIQRSIAVALATVAHRSDIDLAGAATIDHVARVAESFDPTMESVRHCAAWLHDVLERSDLAEHDLLEAGILPHIVEIVSLLTRRDGVDDASRLAAIGAHPDARAVKLASLADNAAPWRLRRLDAAVRAGIESAYAEAIAALGAQV